MNTEVKNSIDKLKKIAHLQDSFSVKQQAVLIKEMSKCSEGLRELLELLISRRLKRKDSLHYIDGIIFQYLHDANAAILHKAMERYFHDGIVQLESSYNMNYKPLYESLISNNFKAANDLTQKYLRVLAGLGKKDERRWLYFTDALALPTKDLRTIDTLWRIYSGGQFGFSIQKEVWIHNNRNWEKFWHKIGWKIDKKSARYPNDFIWNTSAPEGHLPLFNQIRGVQVLAALFMHPALRNIKQ